MRRMGLYREALTPLGWVRRSLLRRPFGWAMLGAQEFPCWWERPRRGQSRCGTGIGKGAKAGRAEPTSGGKDVTAHPAPPAHLEPAGEGPSVRSCATRSWPQVPRANTPALPSVKMKGRCQALTQCPGPSRWLQLLSGVSSPFPEVPGGMEPCF